MVIVKNRQMLFSNREQYIGTSYDNNSTNLSFRLDRINEDGYDMAGLVFKLDIKYSDTNTLNTLNTVKDVNDDYVTITTPITSSVLAHEGTHIIQIRAYESSGTFKWSSFQNVIYIENSLGSVPASAAALSELEQLEARIDADIASNAAAEAARVTAESARVTAELARVSAERARVSAESARVSAETARVSAETARVGAESTRVSTFNTNEAQRTSTFNTNEAQRTSTASASEASRESTFTANESQRTATFNADIAGWEERVTSIETGFDAASLLAQSYATGGTGTREGEDTDNAKYYKEQAQAVSVGSLKYASEKIHFGDTDSSVSGGETSSIVAEDENGVAKKYTFKDTTARSSASSAQTTANTAVSNAATAQSAAEAAQSTANTAVSNAATAQSAAEAAQSTANTAVSNAATAQSTANTAVSNAATAQSTANTAVSNAATAQSTANTAVSNAATAQTAADNAMARASIQSNDNLIDNPCFFINQRGASIYNTAGYTFDRWKIESGLTVKIDSSTPPYKDLHVTSSSPNLNLEQIIDLAEIRANGKTLTFSINRNNSIESITFDVPSTAPSSNTNLVNRTIHTNISLIIQHTTANMLRVLIRSSDGNVFTVRSVKLELGSVSTLANDSAPNYAAELVKCMRYLQKTQQRIVLYNSYTADGYLIVGMPIPIQMRTTPSATFNMYNGSGVDVGGTVTSSAINQTSVSWIKYNTALSAGVYRLMATFYADL